MIQKPLFTSSAEILAKLRTDYRLTIDSLQFLPVGEDSWCYLAEGNRENWFIKISRYSLYPPSITIPALLRKKGCSFVNPAFPNRQGHLWNTLAEHAFVVYPFISGKMVIDRILPIQQWQKIGAIFATLHRTTLVRKDKRSLKVEDFVPPRADGAKRVIAHAMDTSHTKIATELLSDFIQGKVGEMQAIIARAENLGRELQEQQPEMVLCHADPNQANILITPDERILLVDWDGVMLAPRERDLTFFTGKEHRAFMQGYDHKGTYTLNSTAIAYYKYEWVVQEFCDYGTRVFFSDVDEQEKWRALKEFTGLFDPGDVVQEAYAADKDSIS